MASGRDEAMHDRGRWRNRAWVYVLVRGARAAAGRVGLGGVMGRGVGLGPREGGCRRRPGQGAAF